MSDEFWPQQRVLITGGAGFLGAWLTKLLHDEGARIAWADRNESYACLDALDPDARPRAFYLTNVANAPDVEEIFESFAPTVVLHMAGQSHINAAQASGVSAMWANVVGTLNILGCAEICQKLYPVRVVVASSNHVYGPIDHTAMDEDTPLRQTDIYGASKACVDTITRALALANHRPWVVLRNVNAFGPADPHTSHLVTGTIKSLLASETPVLRSDGSPAKQYLFAEDVARAYLIAAKLADNPALRGRAFNVAPATEPESSIAMVMKVCQAYGEPFRPVDIRGGAEQRRYYEYLNGAEFRKVTGWAPRWTLTEGLTETISWYRSKGYQWIPSP